MIKRYLQMLFPVLCCILVSSCSGADTETAPTSTSEPQKEITVFPAPESEPAEHDGPQEYHTVLDDILGVQPQDIERFTYYDNPALYYSDDGAVFPTGDSQATYQCGHNSLYPEVQNTYTLQLAQALETYRLEEQAEVVDGATPLPDGRYFSIWPSLRTSDWLPVLTFYDSGEVYVDANGGGDRIHRLWRATDSTQFDELLGLLEEIHAGLNALPLDYLLSMYLRLDYIRPESEALRLGFFNDGGDVVTVEAFALEREVQGGWERLGQTAATDLAIAPNRQYTLYTVDLTAIPGAREPGKYRVTGTLSAGAKTLPMELAYTIAEDATDISSPRPPDMTPENAEYSERYVSGWGLYSPFVSDFDEENYLPVYHPLHLFRIMAYAEGKGEEYDREYGVHVPGELLEEMVQRHFLFTAEQLREWMPTRQENSEEYYDPETRIYHFEGGYGGVGYFSVVSDSHREGDRLTLTCDWYDYEDHYVFSQELTLRLGEGENDFVYVAGRMLESE